MKLICPECGEKLPYVDNTKMNADKTVRVWRRRCKCGVEVVDTAIYNREVIYPESAPLPEIKHPGEGGMGPCV